MGCAEDLSGLKRGDISSPSWPGAYAENTHCKYTLSVEDNLQLELHFSEGFDVEQSPEGDCIDELRVRIESQYSKIPGRCFFLFLLKRYSLYSKNKKEEAETEVLKTWIKQPEDILFD